MTTQAQASEGTGHARYTYRPRLPRSARRALEAGWDRCRWIWNECVDKSKQTHQRAKATGEKLTRGPAQLDRMLTEARGVTPWLAEGSCVPQQRLIRDSGKSRAKALKDVRDRLSMRQPTGTPRFERKGTADPSLNYTKRGFRIKDGRPHLAGGIVVRPVWSRELPKPPSSVRVYRDNIGHWYASFVADSTTGELPQAGRVLGVDWGVKETATTTSDDHDLPHAQHGNKAQAKLARHQRTMARRRRPKGRAQPKGYRKAQRQTAKLRRKVARQRQDTGRKWAKMVVRDHDAIAVEDVRPKFLAKITMVRKAADGTISAPMCALIEMGRKHGRDVRLVHPRHTTMECADRGARTKHALPLSERTYTCTVCGVSRPRDKNSAYVMLVRAGLTPDGADGVRPTGRCLRGRPEP